MSKTAIWAGFDSTINEYVKNYSDGSVVQVAEVYRIEWEDGEDETVTGWWYTFRGTRDILESGTLTEESEREDVLEAIARKLGYAEAVER